MSAVEANACYNPQSNDITFPALLLQKPFMTYTKIVQLTMAVLAQW
ncbi:hypothetical protein SDC49_03810 [Lactobacillus sp. R2/2]|nr:hypothetical protein [Lactobacillus sp. R2/2]